MAIKRLSVFQFLQVVQWRYAENDILFSGDWRPFRLLNETRTTTPTQTDKDQHPTVIFGSDGCLALSDFR